MRERLIELLEYGLEESELQTNPEGECLGTDIEKFADYLLENGVVVLPCNVGDDVWTLSLDKYCIIGKKTGWTHKIEHWSFKYRLLDLYEFGKTLFLTKEEAEKALKRSKSE